MQGKWRNKGKKESYHGYLKIKDINGKSRNKKPGEAPGVGFI